MSLKRITAVLATLLLFLLPSAGRDFYWEHPVPVTNTDSRFPSTSSNGLASALIWQA